MSLTPHETQLVQSFQSWITESTLSREILAEELRNFHDPLFVDEHALFAFRLMLTVELNPGATAKDLSRKLGRKKQRTIERLLAKFRKVGVVGAWTKVRRGSGLSQAQGIRKMGLFRCSIG